MFCPFCGKAVPEGAVRCPECGQAPAVTAQPAKAAVSPKSRLALSLMAGFLGVPGVHRFYAGRILSGCIMLLLFLAGMFFTLGSAIILFATKAPEFTSVMIAGALLLVVLEIWLIIDIILALCGRFKDRRGRLISVWSHNAPPTKG